MSPESPFAKELFWKRIIGVALIIGGVAAGAATIFLGGEVIDGLDLVVLAVEIATIIGGLGLALSPDPARL